LWRANWRELGLWFLTAILRVMSEQFWIVGLAIQALNSQWALQRVDFSQIKRFSLQPGIQRKTLIARRNSYPGLKESLIWAQSNGVCDQLFLFVMGRFRRRHHHHGTISAPIRFRLQLAAYAELMWVF
jgi:hypothetical protein